MNQLLAKVSEMLVIVGNPTIIKSKYNIFCNNFKTAHVKWKILMNYECMYPVDNQIVYLVSSIGIKMVIN